MENNDQLHVLHMSNTWDYRLWTWKLPEGSSGLVNRSFAWFVSGWEFSSLSTSSWQLLCVCSS